MHVLYCETSEKTSCALYYKNEGVVRVYIILHFLALKLTCILLSLKLCIPCIYTCSFLYHICLSLVMINTPSIIDKRYIVFAVMQSQMYALAVCDVCISGLRWEVSPKDKTLSTLSGID